MNLQRRLGGQQRADDRAGRASRRLQHRTRCDTCPALAAPLSCSCRSGHQQLRDGRAGHAARRDRPRRARAASTTDPTASASARGTRKLVAVEQAVARPGHPGQAVDGVRGAHRRHATRCRRCDPSRNTSASSPSLITARARRSPSPLGRCARPGPGRRRRRPAVAAGFRQLGDGRLRRRWPTTSPTHRTRHPVKLPVAEDIPAGRTDPLTLAPGTAHRIMTGAPLPAGATAVVPVEATDGGDRHRRRSGRARQARPAHPARGRGRHRGHHGAARRPGPHPRRTRAGRRARPRRAERRSAPTGSGDVDGHRNWWRPARRCSPARSTSPTP